MANNFNNNNNNNCCYSTDTPSNYSSSSSSENAPRTLPTSIEGATYRYLKNYTQQFVGPAAEMKRLSALAEAKIILLRTKAPVFYETRLAKLVNQAASALLACNRNTTDGQAKFHELHKNFLRVLDELAKSQPAGEVDFQTEKDRAEERDRLLKQHLKLRKRVSEMEGTELSADILGDEDEDNTTSYARFWADLEAKKRELEQVSLMISKLDGERIDDDVEFKLNVKPRSTLARLTLKEQEQLENQILEMLRHNKKKINLVNYQTIEEHINRLNIEPGRFKQIEMRDLIKDALDAYTCYFRDLDNQRRCNFHELLLNDPYLKPKDGIILESPEDLPADVLKKMDSYGTEYQRKIDDVMEKFKNEEDVTDTKNDEGDNVEEVCDNEEDEDDFLEDKKEAFVEEYFSNKRGMIDRIKEEPRDDYNPDEDSSDDERSVPVSLATSVENTLQLYKKHKPECITLD